MLITNETAAIPGATDMFVKLLRMIDGEPPSRGGEEDRRTIFAKVWQDQQGEGRANPNKEMIAYIQDFLAREPFLSKDKAPTGEDYLRLYTTTLSRKWAHRVLETWGEKPGVTGKADAEASGVGTQGKVSGSEPEKKAKRDAADDQKGSERGLK